MKISEDSSAKYHQDNKERLPKKSCERLGIPAQEHV